MERFDEKGMLIIPNPVSQTTSAHTVVVVQRVFCPHGHSLINKRADFNGYPGIIIAATRNDEHGFIALSPIYGDKRRIALDIDLIDGKTYDLSCPECGAVLPRFGTCKCGADLISLFLTQEADNSNCTVICNRVGCPNAQIIASGEVISETLFETEQYAE